MSFALTTDQIQAETKDVTRRLGWLFLKPGEMVSPVKKCMGLRPGERMARLRAPLRIVSTRREPLRAMLDDPDYGAMEIAREGFRDHPLYSTPHAWVRMFCETHKGCTPESIVTRIEFAYGSFP